MRRISIALAAALASIAAATDARAQAITPPAAFLGRPVGADFQLADWSEVSGYFKQLDAESPRVLVEVAGTSSEGREFLAAAISSEANLANLAAIRANAARIADPRGLNAQQKAELLATAIPIAVISLAMHSTETAAPQFGMEFAHLLATSDDEPWKSARERSVVVVLPCTNPDGLDEVVQWYRRTVATPYEGTGLLRLYQLYSGHDNNRDWFMLSQAETRAVTRLLYQVWHPQVYWDVHQQGTRAERIFVPPFRDPLNPNLDPAIVAGIDLIGTRALFDMTAAGLSGVATGVTFDMWWNGGNRNVPVRHNIVGLLTEAASVNLASPVFLEPSSLAAPGDLGLYAPSNQFPMPWPGGWWRLRDIIDYELAFGKSLLGSLAREPELWCRGALAAAERQLALGADDAPRAWIVPSDNRDRGAVRRLADVLLETGVEVHAAQESFRADGRDWPKGSLVIQRDQPYGAHVKDLFDVQRYPGKEPPYDVAGWTLPFLLGVRRVEVMAPFEAPLARVATKDEAVAGFPGLSTAERADAGDSDSWRTAFAKLGAGAPLWFVTAGDAAGCFQDAEPAAKNAVRIPALPRIGLYQPWSGSMDEGWMRYVFDSSGLAFVGVRNEMLRAGELEEFLDVLVLPGVGAGSLDRGRADGSVHDRYAGGLDPEGAVAVEEFVRRGGTLIAVSGSAAWANELFRLKLEDAARGDAAGDFSCPGSVLRTVPFGPSRFTAGLPESIAAFFAGSSAWKRPKDGKRADDAVPLEFLLTWAPTRTLLSGWIRKPEVIADQGAWVRATYGAGAIHLFAFEPQYRSWSQACFHLLFRAILLEKAA